MDSKITKREFEKALRRFRDYAGDVSNSNYKTFDAYFNLFIKLCENDPALKVITMQLKNNIKVDLMEWVKETRNERVLILDDDEENRLALMYQFFLGLQQGKIGFAEFGLLVFGESNYDSMIYCFNNQIFDKFVREMEYRLSELEDSLSDKNEIENKDLIIFNNFDVSIINNGVVEINGNKTEQYIVYQTTVQNFINTLLEEIQVNELTNENQQVLESIKQGNENVSSDKVRDVFDEVIRKFPKVASKLTDFVKSIPPEFAKTVIIESIKGLLGL